MVSEGFLPLADGMLAKYTGRPEGGEEKQAWGAAKLKSPRRAIEKILRAYSGNTSLVLDVCRHRLVFERVADLRRCLECILEDGEVVVVGPSPFPAP